MHSTTSLLTRAATIVVMMALPVLASAQLVRGNAVSRAGEPLVGVVVMLLDSTDNTVTRVLSNEAGEFRVVAPRPGSYKLRALRIGYLPVTSGVFSLAAGASTAERLVMDDSRVELSAMRVVGKTSCTRDARNSAALMNAWDQAVASMAAVALGSTSALTATTMRITRELDGGGKRVNSQVVSFRTANVIEPWRSAPVDSLHLLGYVWADKHDSLSYHVPGLDVFLSPLFLEDHCLQPTTGPDTTEIGVHFGPTSERRNMPEVQGVLWMTRATAALRRMEFSFVNVPGMERVNAPAGGSMEFAQLPNGTVLITGWEIKMPTLTKKFARDAFARVTAIAASGGRTVLIQNGADTLYRGKFLTFKGSVVDSASAVGVAGATVRLVGTNLRTSADANGRFVFNNMLPGEYSIEVKTPSLDSIGESAQTSAVVFEQMPDVLINVPSAVHAAGKLCPANRDPQGRLLGGIYGVLQGGGDSTAWSDVEVEANWTRFGITSTENEAIVKKSKNLLGTRTDARGVFQLCGIPVDYALTLTAKPARGIAPPLSLRLMPSRRLMVVGMRLNQQDDDDALPPPRTSAAPLPEFIGGPSADAASEFRAAALTGMVTDSAARPLSNVEVAIPTLKLLTRTDSAGQFRIADITPGIHAVVVRRVGYGPVTASLVFTDNETEVRNFVLRAVTVLANVAVNAERSDAFTAEFEDRAKRGIGTFLTREKLSKFDEHTLARIVSQLPGARAVRGSGNRTWVASLRSNGGLGMEGKSTLSTSDKMSGASKTQCYAKVYVDDALVYGGLEGGMLFDVNTLQVSQVEAIEYYAGSAQTPARYGGLGAHCGVLVIWTRRPK